MTENGHFIRQVLLHFNAAAAVAEALLSIATLTSSVQSTDPAFNG